MNIGDETIPTVDISAWLSPESSQQARDRVVEEVSHACSKYGFFNLVGHGVPVEARQQIFECAKAFFNLPLEEKMKISVDKSLGKSFRGYEPSRIQTHQTGLLPDTKECFITGAEVPADHPDAGKFSTGPNLWPEVLPDEEFRQPVMEYRARLLELVGVLVRILSQGLNKAKGHPPDVLNDILINPSIPMRLLHYAPETDIDPRQFGVGDHTDFGCVSILLQQAGTKGLEVWYPPKESWIPVPVIENAFVINMGDTMHRWTGGFYRSARHRVYITGERRYSVAFFLNGNLKLKIKPLDGSGEEASVGEHINSRLAHTLGDNAKYLR
ncbi:hypothetical protein EYZ11_006389 [Aspergillus tanneri]|uniref:Fe2OG dioxygenase domain-containing protein n=1 Tax=Aspergillus tanneri TaxID=1220188 RepID=A0A4S3JG01_9EURO|nr:uncharacterized protein ATNIH1004_001830 [Aspergillus tanneri]KAA8652921.1 hypothetical protein ATNIH1004_001830 [Aspergillus tanneri]THC94140.1 hypothetical protein EYZ11_006389 [Aspergillus tanneri]